MSIFKSSSEHAAAIAAKQAWIDTQLHEQKREQITQLNIIAAQQQYGLNNNTIHVGAIAGGAEVWHQQHVPTFDPNNTAGWNTSITTMKDLWTARYGHKWVRNTELLNAQGDADVNFWRVAAERLRDLRMLEAKHEWLRLREDV